MIIPEKSKDQEDKQIRPLGHWASPRIKSSQKIRPLGLNGKYCPYADNKSATHTAAKHFSHGRTKHTSVLSLYQRYLIERPLFFHKCLQTCSSTTFLPKAINPYEFLICKLMLFHCLIHLCKSEGASNSPMEYWTQIGKYSSFTFLEFDTVSKQINI